MNGALAPAALENDGKRRQRLLQVGRAEQALVPGERGIEVVHQARGEHVRVARCEGVKRLRRDGVEERIDGIGIGGLQAGVGLKAEPGDVAGVDVVVDASRLHLLAVVARMRNALAVGAAVSVGRVAACGAAVAVERAAENRQRSPRGVAVQREHLPVEGHQLGRRLVRRSGDRVHPAARQLLQHVSLKCGRGHGGGGHDGQGDAHPFGVEEEEQLVAADGAAETAPEMIHRRARLVVPGGGVGEEIGGVRTASRSIARTGCRETGWFRIW